MLVNKCRGCNELKTPPYQKTPPKFTGDFPTVFIRDFVGVFLVDNSRVFFFTYQPILCLTKLRVLVYAGGKTTGIIHRIQMCLT